MERAVQQQQPRSFFPDLDANVISEISKHLNSDARVALFHTCRQTRDALLATAPSIRFSLSPRHNQRHELLARAASRPADLRLEFSPIHDEDETQLETLLLHGLHSGEKWTAVRHLQLVGEAPTARGLLGHHTAHLLFLVFPALSTLQLEHMRVTGTGLASLAASSTLTKLNLVNVDLDDAARGSLPVLSRAPQLSTWNMGSTRRPVLPLPSSQITRLTLIWGLALDTQAAAAFASEVMGLAAQLPLLQQLHFRLKRDANTDHTFQLPASGWEQLSTCSHIQTLDVRWLIVRGTAQLDQLLRLPALKKLTLSNIIGLEASRADAACNWESLRLHPAGDIVAMDATTAQRLPLHTLQELTPAAVDIPIDADTAAPTQHVCATVAALSRYQGHSAVGIRVAPGHALGSNPEPLLQALSPASGKVSEVRLSGITPFTAGVVAALAHACPSLSRLVLVRCHITPDALPALATACVQLSKIMVQPTCMGAVGAMHMVALCLKAVKPLEVHAWQLSAGELAEVYELLAACNSQARLTGIPTAVNQQQPGQ